MTGGSFGGPASARFFRFQRPRPLLWLRRTWARYRVAQRLKVGRYVFRGTGGEPLIVGRVRGRIISLDLEPAMALRSGTVRLVEIYRGKDTLALQIPQKAMRVSRKQAFVGRRIRFP